MPLSSVAVVAVVVIADNCENWQRILLSFLARVAVIVVAAAVADVAVAAAVERLSELLLHFFSRARVARSSSSSNWLATIPMPINGCRCKKTTHVYNQV